MAMRNSRGNKVELLQSLLVLIDYKCTTRTPPEPISSSLALSKLCPLAPLPRPRRPQRLRDSTSSLRHACAQPSPSHSPTQTMGLLGVCFRQYNNTRH